MKSKKNAPARDIRAEMIDLYRESPEGKTEADLIAAGFTKEEIATHAPDVAAIIRAESFSKAA